MKQSESRVAGRRQGPPASFGRQPEPEPEDGDFRIVGGEAFHLVLHVEVTPTAESMEALYRSVREATAAGVRDGYAQAIAALDEAQELARAEETPDDGRDGGPSSG